VPASTIIIYAFLLDLAIGDPAWLPHPVRIIGKGIAGMEKFLRTRFDRSNEKAAGIALVVSIVVPVFVVMYAAQEALYSFSSSWTAIAGTIILIYLTSTTLALRELVASSKQVINAVRDGALEDARKYLSMIVGRDTERLAEKGVLRATIETLAENLSDGFIAPLFYFILGGLPLAMAYKAVNTLDSMVGYKNERYLRFGWAAAKLDDVANYIPARIAGLCIVVSVFLYAAAMDFRKTLSASSRALRIMLRDGGNHSSPNSGVPEAAMAGALGVMLGGPSTYGGVLVEKPFIGDRCLDINNDAAGQAVTLVVIASFLAMAVAVTILDIISW